MWHPDSGIALRTNNPVPRATEQAQGIQVLHDASPLTDT